MKAVSLICVYNKNELLSTMVESCKAQTIGFDNIEFVLIDNTSTAFPSAAAALNFGADKATTDKLIFLHQDIEFLESNALEYIVDYLNQNPLTLIGAAGVKGKEYGYTGDIVSSMRSGPWKSQYTKEINPQEVFVLDECLFGCNKQLFETIRFDEILCDSWHLYAADLCLQAITKHYPVVVLPLYQVWHKSFGCADKSYYRTQNALAKKYRKQFKIINTTNGYVYTNPTKRTLLNLYRTVRYRKNHM